MNPKVKKIVGYVARGLLSAMLLPGGVMQLIAHPQVVTHLQHAQIGNVGMIRFLGFLKILGAIGIWVPAGRLWAIHGITFLFLGALSVHFGAGDPPTEFIGATMGLAFLIASEMCLVGSKDLRASGHTIDRAA